MDMPKKKRTVAAQAAERGPLPSIPPELVEQLVQGPMTPQDVQALFLSFKKAVIERAMNAELTQHLGYEVGQPKPEGQRNERNGASGKTVITDTGAVRIEVPRDREGGFEPILIPKHERRFTGFDDKILALYARGLTVRDIRAFLHEMYAVDVSPDLISTVTDAVQEEVLAWQTRPLEPMYPVVFFDALRVKMRDEGVVQSKAVYLALAILPDGTRDILGLWVEQTEGAKFWMKVFADLQARGCHDILIAVTDGLTGMGDALEAVYPRTTWQTCVVHLLRRSLAYANWKERKAFAVALRPIYTAPSAAAAEAALTAVAAGPWGCKFPTVMTAWRRAWPQVIPFFAFPPDIRRTLYTTNALENVNRQIRKATKTRGHFPNDEAAIKLIWLAIRNLTARWARGEHHWKDAMNQFAILYGDRFERPQV